jgi:hypothetical protein
MKVDLLWKHLIVHGVNPFRPEKQKGVVHDLSARPMVSIGG